MSKIDRVDYKVGDLMVAATFIVNGLPVKRIDKVMDSNSKIRVLFVFDKTAADELEVKYLSYDCQVAARKYTDTISSLRAIIKNTVNNIIER